MLNTIVNYLEELIGPFKRTSNTSDILHLLSNTIQPRSFVDKEILLHDVRHILDKTGLYTSYEINVFGMPSSHHLVIVGNTHDSNQPTNDPAFDHVHNFYSLQDNQEFIFSYVYSEQRDKPDVLDESQADLHPKLQGKGLGTEIIESIYKQASQAGYKYAIGMHLKPKLVRYFSHSKPYRVHIKNLPVEIQDYLTDSSDPLKHQTTVALLDKINTISQ